MISIKLPLKWGVYQLLLWTLLFDRMGRLGQIRSIQTPCKILTLGTEIKKLAGGTFESIHYQSRISKKLFLEGIPQLSIMVWPTIVDLPKNVFSYWGGVQVGNEELIQTIRGNIYFQTLFYTITDQHEIYYKRLPNLIALKNSWFNTN